MEKLSARRLCFSHNSLKKYVINQEWLISSSPKVAQTFSIPENIVYHLRRNATNPLTLINLQRTCKYFASYYKIVELKDLLSLEMGEFLRPTTTVGVGSRKIKTTEEQLLSWPVHYAFTGILDVRKYSMPQLASRLLSKAYISNLWRMDLTDQILTFKEYKFLTVNTSFIDLNDCRIFDEDMQIVPAPQLIPWNSDLESFNFFSEDAAYFPHEALQEMASKTLSSLLIRKVNLYFRYLPFDYDPTLIVKFLMNNQSENLMVSLDFGPENDTLGRNIQEFVNENLQDLPKEKKPMVKGLAIFLKVYKCKDGNVRKF